MNVDVFIPPSASEDLGDSFYSYAWTNQQVIKIPVNTLFVISREGI
ncbi:hypothetical protein BSBH6_00765 [Bacillus subtilis]|nr:hypothetical protein BSBH6_00765 [Bacillus subtilis]RPK27128.1 hypothetical protein BH5_00763 [Bacillus subtilis]